MKHIFTLCALAVIALGLNAQTTQPAGPSAKNAQLKMKTEAAKLKSGKPVLNHLALYVVNLEEATRFYRDVIGLDTIPEPFHDGRHTWFAIAGPNSHLHLIQGAKEKTAHEKNIHTCFSVPSVEDFIKVLDKNKIPYENWAGEKQAVTNRVDGIKQLWLRDPDGYWVEINNDYK